jgi:hypothetical protein
MLELDDLAIRELSHYGFLGGHPSKSQLRNPMAGFVKISQYNIMNSFILKRGVLGNCESEIIKKLIMNTSLERIPEIPK